MKLKSILITGASSGIGEACARLLSTPETVLFLVARRGEKLRQLKQELSGNVVIIPYDLNELEHIKGIFEEIRKYGVKLDGMIHSAGINAECPVKVNTVSLMTEAMRVNCFSFAELGKFFYSKRYSNDGASIVAISSIASFLCSPGMAPYTASKAALNAYVKTMAKEFLRRKIRVNAVLPAGVCTEMTDSKLEKNDGLGSNYTQPLGGIPASVIAKAVLYLLSDDSAFTTGTLLPISAGIDF